MKTQTKILTYSPEGLKEKLLDNSKGELRFLSKSSFDEAVENGMTYRIAGKTMLKEADKDEERVLCFHDQRYCLTAGRLTRCVGYIPVGDGQFVEYRQSLLLLLILLLAAMALIGTEVWIALPKASKAVLAPDYALAEVDKNQEILEEDTFTHTLAIEIPNGYVSFVNAMLDFENEELRASNAEFTEKAYSGPLHVKAYMTTEEAEYLVFDSDQVLNEGMLVDALLDFTILKTELISGLYNGRLILDYGGGQQIESPLVVAIHTRKGGTMDIGFSPIAEVVRSSSSVSMSYTSGTSATHDTIVQLILVKDETEYLLAESGVVKPGKSLSKMELKRWSADLLEDGVYSGYLRLNFFDEKDKQADPSMTTDIDIEIYVH